MLALKLTLVPLFVWVVSMSGRWWGPTIAGWLAGLPVVAGPILYFLVLAQGPVFGARAATLAVAAILASEAFNFAYAWTCRAHSWPVALSAGLVAWFIGAWGLSWLPPSPLWAIVAALIAVCLGQSFLPRTAVILEKATPTRADLIGRMTAGAVLTVSVTSLSYRMGAAWSGVLAVFPLLGIVLSVSCHRAHGPDYVVALLRGMVLGRFSFAAFCLSLTFSLPRQPPWIAFAEAAAMALLLQGGTRRFALRRRMTAPRSTDVRRAG